PLISISATVVSPASRRWRPRGSCCARSTRDYTLLRVRPGSRAAKEPCMADVADAPRAVSLTRERDGVALIRLHRPPANSYNRAFLDELNAAIDEVRWDDGL